MYSWDRERERGEKTFQPEGITSKGLKHGGIRKNADSLAGRFIHTTRGITSATSSQLGFIWIMRTQNVRQRR